LDERGRPVVHARVILVSSEFKIQRGPLLNAETGEHGKFECKNLSWGEYRVFAMKESAGFPNTYFAFYSNDLFSKATVTPAVKVANVVLRVKKAATLQGDIKDSSTGKTLTAVFEFSRKDSPSFSITTSFSSKFKVLIPANTDVVAKVTATGFYDWFYPSAQNRSQAGVIRLRPGEHKMISVSLRPLDTSQDSRQH
jgi:hypothetical protein